MNEMLKDSDIIVPVTNEIGGSEEPEEPDPPPTPEEPPKVEEIKGGEAFDEKTTIEDAEGNKIVVPAGFKIASDSGNTVQQGIVIEDVSASADTTVQGSQFVWIPVGEFIKDGFGFNSQLHSALDGTPYIGRKALENTMLDLIADTIGALTISIICSIFYNKHYVKANKTEN